MSRTRQSPNEMDLWLFPLKTTDTNNHIENSDSLIGIHFKGEEMGLKTRQEREVMSGRVLRSTTTRVYKTMEQINFNIGDTIATIPNPSRADRSSIVKISSKPQNKRGARHNTTRVEEYTIEVS